MPADRLLITLLRALQTSSKTEETPRLLATATSLYTTLANPLNLSLLTAQLLAAPSIWGLDLSLRSCHRVIGTYSSAAGAILKHEDDLAEDPDKAQPAPGQPVIGGNLSRDDWVKAVTSGADDRSPRWRHVLVLAGLLLGFEQQERHGLGRHLKHSLATALVSAANAALEDVRLGAEEHGGHAVVLSLNYCWDLLDDREKADINCDKLLPALMGAAFFSQEGYRSGYFFASVDPDIVQVSERLFTWSQRSASFNLVSDTSSRPLVTSMGPLSKVLAYTVEQLSDPFLIQTLMDDLLDFSKTIANQWRRTKLSEVDAKEEGRFFDQTAMSQTLPVLWKLLRSSLFTTCILLQAVLSRALADRALATDTLAQAIASQTLHILRNLYFISSRLGPNTLSQYTFIYLTSIDVLTSHPNAASAFIDEIRPEPLGQIPSHPLDRNLDLYFLNTAEHFTLALSPDMNRDLLIAASTPYLAAGGDNNILDIFEAAHSVTLAVFSAPQNAELAASHVPFYVDTLFKVFPQNLSARQFRLAFKTLIGITTPPSLLSASHPDLPEILLELVYERVVKPKAEPRPPLYTAPESTSTNATASSQTMIPPQHPGAEASEDAHTAFVLTLIDSLPHLPVPMLEEWLPRTAELIPNLDARQSREQCRQRFWEVLSQGEMDVERSQVAVAWWGTFGGREMVLLEKDQNAGMMMMSGALAPKDGSRL